MFFDHKSGGLIFYAVHMFFKFFPFTPDVAIVQGGVIMMLNLAA